MGSPKSVTIHYYAVLREQRGLREETLETEASTPSELYEVLSRQYGFHLDKSLIKVAINDEFKGMDSPIQPGDRLVYIPPVAGG